MAASFTPDDYFAASRSWEADRVSSAQRSAWRAWWVAGAACLVSVVTAVALVRLVPLRTSEPYLIRVDGSSGIVDVVPTYHGSGNVDELITRHLLQMYVVSRERYVGALAEHDYEVVGALQSAALNQAWLQLWDRARPESPLNLYRDGTVVRAQVQAISFLKNIRPGSNVAQVRFLTFTRPAGAGVERVAHWIGTLAYAYGPAPKDDRQRLTNPLGLRVTEYQRDAELTADMAATP